jgi:hypothetical protein
MGGGRAYGDLGAGRDGDPALGRKLGPEDLRRAGDEAHAEGRVGEHLYAELALWVQFDLARRLRGRGRGPRDAGGGHRAARVSGRRRDWRVGVGGRQRERKGSSGV